jgi:amino acid transporter
MFNKLKETVTGPPLPTHQMMSKRLNKIRALAAFSPDALSSIAYANQEIYLGLVVAGSAGLSLAWPIGLAITTLLILLAISYYQTIQGYPSGGGSFIVAKDNLGTLPGVIAAAALLIDYLLTAAVSLTAGMDAIASAFPALLPYKVIMALAVLAIITVINLRGIRESGTAMAIPVYFFLITYLAMLAYGAVLALIQGPGTLPASAPAATVPVTLFLLLHTFSSGCTAITGIEAISNGIPAFQPPESKNAGKTLVIMAVLMGLLFVGSIGLTQYLAVTARPEETILSAFAHRLLGNSLGYYVIQASTTLILAVAANTSFADFPRLSAILAREGFLPRPLSNLGDRLVFNNGILMLAGGTAALILFFGGDTHALIPLFAVGVFLAFTLSQTGMVVHWWRKKGKGWGAKAIANGIGALATCITLVIVCVSKFTQGAWIIVVLIPIFGTIFLRIHDHFKHVSAQLSMSGHPPSLNPGPPPRVVVPISGVHRGIVGAINFARSISPDVTAFYIELEAGAAERVKNDWQRWWPDVPLVIRPSSYRSIITPLIDFLDETDREHNDGQQAVVVLPEFIPAHWWQGLLHNQASLMIKATMLYHRRQKGFQRVMIDVPYHLKK